MRIPKPHWKESHKCWYVKLRGRFYRLDPDRDKAFDLYTEMLSRFTIREGLRPAATLTVRDVLSEFLGWIKRNRKPATLGWYRQYILGSERSGKYHEAGFLHFCPPALLARDLKPFHLTNWLDSRYPKANPTTRAGAITAIQQGLKWATGEGYITVNPLQGYKKPRPLTRGIWAYLTPEQWTQIVEYVRDNPAKREVESFLDYCTVVRMTGCRPQEIRVVEARHLDNETRRWIFEVSESKAGDRTGRKRIVELGQQAYEICRKLALRYPDGPLFRNSDDRPWTKYAIAHRFRNMARELGFKVSAYSLRHTFATEALFNGADPVTVARLMGHVDLNMLNKVYEHVMADKEHIEASRAKATVRAAM
jgi:integrase/recombinase XerD